MSDDPSFDIAIAYVLRDEGGYVNDPDDAGGETKYGICKRDYPEVDIANLTIAQATEIYRRDWWDKVGFGRLHPRIACKVFDLAVNMGSRPEITLLQRAINDVRGVFVAVDGVLGDGTVAAANACPDDALMAALRDEAERHYRDIVATHPRDAKYLNGWLRRADE